MAMIDKIRALGDVSEMTSEEIAKAIGHTRAATINELTRKKIPYKKQQGAVIQGKQRLAEVEQYLREKKRVRMCDLIRHFNSSQTSMNMTLNNMPNVAEDDDGWVFLVDWN